MPVFDNIEPEIARERRVICRMVVSIVQMSAKRVDRHSDKRVKDLIRG